MSPDTSADASANGWLQLILENKEQYQKLKEELDEIIECELKDLFYVVYAMILSKVKNVPDISFPWKNIKQNRKQ